MHHRATTGDEDAEQAAFCPLCRLSWHASCSNQVLHMLAPDLLMDASASDSQIIRRLLSRELSAGLEVDASAANPHHSGWHAAICIEPGWANAATSLQTLSDPGTTFETPFILLVYRIA
jgi:hypothetical protein